MVPRVSLSPYRRIFVIEETAPDIHHNLCLREWRPLAVEAHVELARMVDVAVGIVGMLVDHGLELTDIVVAEIRSKSEVEIEFCLDETVIEIYLILRRTLKLGIALAGHKRRLVYGRVEVIYARTVYAPVV